MFFGEREIKLSRLASATSLFVVLATGCASDRARDAASTSAAIEMKDDAGHVVRLAHPAHRVLSLVPSMTETLIAIGATSDLIGRTRYDEEPAIASLPSVGGALDASVESIVALRPDLVITWQNEARGSTRDRLVSLGIPVYVAKTEDTTDIFRGIAAAGRVSGRDSVAGVVAASVRRELDDVRRIASGHPSPKVFYVVYTDPPMTAGPRTFVGQLIALAGGTSIFTDSSRLWPNVAMEEIVRRDPDLVLVPVNASGTNTLDRLKQITGWRDLRAVRTGHVVTIPDNVVNRPSPAIAQTARVLLAAIHPELVGDSSRRGPEARAR